MNDQPDKQYYQTKERYWKTRNVCCLCPWGRFNPMPNSYTNGMVVSCKMRRGHRGWQEAARTACDAMPGLSIETANMHEWPPAC